VRVQVDPAKIASLGIQLEDVASVIATATVDAPKGSINARCEISRSTTTISSIRRLVEQCRHRL